MRQDHGAGDPYFLEAMLLVAKEQAACANKQLDTSILLDRNPENSLNAYCIEAGLRSGSMSLSLSIVATSAAGRSSWSSCLSSIA
jgi:hypothetical protein